MLARRRIGHQHQARHPRLEHDRIARIKPHHDPLADAINGQDRPPDHATAKNVDPRHDPNRLPPARHTRHIADPRTNNPQNATPHRFHFG
jgi:hypothetical protein